MARELSSQGERQRLVERYRAMSDGELLAMAEELVELTPVAADVLRGELRERGLETPVPEAAVRRGGADFALIDADDLGRSEIALTIFYDAMDAGKARDLLDESEIAFELQDVSQPREGLGFLEMGPPVALRLVVQRGDRDRAMSVLRAQMGLFPLQEVEVADEIVDDGTIAVLGSFGQREDAQGVGLILEEAGIWHRVAMNPEGSAEEEDLYTLEVREIDLMRAGEAVEAGMDLGEE